MRLVQAALSAVALVAAGAPGGAARAPDLVTELDIPEQAEAGAGDRTVYTLGLGSPWPPTTRARTTTAPCRSGTCAPATCITRTPSSRCWARHCGPTSCPTPTGAWA